MIERREVTRDTISALLRLEVRADQRDLVASNAVTLAQAPFETGSRVWGLWRNDQAVGLIAMVHPDEYPWHGEGDDRQSAYLWRLMIGGEFQGQGCGSAAIGHVLQVARDWGLPRVTAGVVDRPLGAMGFYEKMGFRRTGRVIEGEAEIVISV